MAVVFTVLSISALSQFNTYSPYTRFGLGNLSKEGFAQNQAMGGTGVALKSGRILNYLNPAAYSARDSMSVLLDFGMNVTTYQYLTNELSKSWWNGNFHHIALSLPIGKHVGVSTGIVPYSSVGYNIKQEYNNLGTGDAIDYYFKGSGGIMKYFAGASAEVFNRFSFGVNMNYLLGNISRERSMVFPRNPGYAWTEALEEIQISHVYFGLGFQYKEVFGDKFFFTLGAIYDLQTELSSEFSSYVTNNFPGNARVLNDSVKISNTIDIISQDASQIITIPGKKGLGIALGIPDKLTLTGDYYIQDWAAVENNSLSVAGSELATATSLRGGIEYTPDFESFRGYHKLMSYRMGAYMNNSYIKIGDYQLKDYGITFGVGLPLKENSTFSNSKSSINVSASFGTRGTLENNLIKENYGILTFSVTLHDLWFYKRKFE